MPYVPQDVKERIKREVSIQRLAEARGIELSAAARSLSACARSTTTETPA